MDCNLGIPFGNRWLCGANFQTPWEACPIFGPDDGGATVLAQRVPERMLRVLDRARAVRLAVPMAPDTFMR